MALILCRECGRQISDQAMSCPQCGAPRVPAAPTPGMPAAATPPFGGVPAAHLARPTKNRSFAILLAVLLGGLGLHKFYLEKPGWGVLYLLFCWTFIPSVVGIIEGIRYLFMSNQEFAARYSPAPAAL